MINKTNISKTQHYVPQFYLKNFSQRNNKIHVFSKQDNKQFCSNVSKVANEKYFYGIPDVPKKSKTFEKLTEAQRKQEIEEFLSRIDDNSSKALSEFLEQVKSCRLKIFSLESNYENMSLGLLEIDERLRYDLSIFFALQDLRTREYRESTRQFYDGSLTRLLRRKIKYENSDEIKKLKINPKDLKITHTDDAISFLHFRSLLNKEHILGLSNILFNRKWVVGVNNTNIPLFTSDHPLIKHNYKKTFFRGGYSSDEIAIPLSSKYLLIMISPILWEDMTALNNKNVMVQELQKDNVIFYNHLQTTKSYNYVFSNTSEFYMMQDYLKRNPEAKNPFRQRLKFD